MQRLETETKFYEIIVNQYLLGDIVLICYLGGKNSHRHQSKTIKLDSFLQYCKAYKKIITTRFKHGYWFIHHSPQDFQIEQMHNLVKRVNVILGLFTFSSHNLS